MNEITLVVPMTPPSVNSYVRHTRRGGHYKTEQTERFEWAMAEVCRGERVEGKSFAVEMDVYFGPGERRDVDNMGKLPLDCLAKAGVFGGKSDSHVHDLRIRKHLNQRDNPRTELRIRAI